MKKILKDIIMKVIELYPDNLQDFQHNIIEVMKRVQTMAQAILLLTKDHEADHIIQIKEKSSTKILIKE